MFWKLFCLSDIHLYILIIITTLVIAVDAVHSFLHCMKFYHINKQNSLQQTAHLILRQSASQRATCHSPLMASFSGWDLRRWLAMSWFNKWNDSNSNCTAINQSTISEQVSYTNMTDGVASASIGPLGLPTSDSCLWQLNFFQTIVKHDWMSPPTMLSINATSHAKSHAVDILYLQPRFWLITLI